MDVIRAGLLGYAATAAAYLVLTLLALRWWNRALSGFLLIGASAMTCIWASATAYELYIGTSAGALAGALEAFHSAGWILLLLGSLYWISPLRRLTWAVALAGLSGVIASLTFLLAGSG